MLERATIQHLQHQDAYAAAVQHDCSTIELDSSSLALLMQQLLNGGALSRINRRLDWCDQQVWREQGLSFCEHIQLQVQTAAELERYVAGLRPD